MLNKVFLIGNLGSDPEVKYTKDGSMMVIFRIATNEFVKHNGTFEKITEWHTVCAFGKLAEFCSVHLKKGDRIFVEGKLRTSSFESDNKIFRVSNIIAKSIKIIPRGPKNIYYNNENISALDIFDDEEEIREAENHNIKTMGIDQKIKPKSSPEYEPGFHSDEILSENGNENIYSEFSDDEDDGIYGFEINRNRRSHTSGKSERNNKNDDLGGGEEDIF